METFAQIDVTAEAVKVTCPTLILHARGDHRVPMALARELATLIPDSRLVLLNGENHILTSTEPAWPRFVDELERFVSEHDR